MSDMLLAVGPVDALLDARGSSKRWLASKLGMKESTLSRYLSGTRPAPADLYQRIADVLHVPVAFVTPREPNGDTVAA